MKILVVDDSRAMRMIVRRTLRQAGFEHLQVVEAEDGVAALQVIRDERPTLVLSDWNMPRMGGLDLLKALNHIGWTGKFGFVTSEGTNEMRALAAAEGAVFLIAKPFTPEAFRSALKGVVGVAA